MILPRRTLLTGLAAALAMPALVRAENIMRAKAPPPPTIPTGYVRCLFDGHLVLHPRRGDSFLIRVGAGDMVAVPAGATMQPVVEIDTAAMGAGTIIAAIEIGPGAAAPEVRMPLFSPGYGGFAGISA